MLKTISAALVAGAIGLSAMPAMADQTSVRDEMMRQMMNDPAMVKMAVMYYIKHHPHMKMHK